jgi:response regulator NasT
MPSVAPQIRLLIVDDDRLVLANLADGLEQAGYAVSRAATGEEAIRICAETSLDLVIMDVCLPGLSGIETARKIRQISKTPVLFLSAFDTEGMVKEAVADGGLGYLVKPVRLNQLLTSIEAALARAADIKTLETTEEQLRIALQGDRNVGIATGILMERHRLTAAEAFETLRGGARARQRKLSEAAAEIVGACETSSRPRGQK